MSAPYGLVGRRSSPPADAGNLQPEAVGAMLTGLEAAALDTGASRTHRDDEGRPCRAGENSLGSRPPTASSSLALAEATAQAYERDFAKFGQWCARHDRCPLPAAPADIADFLDGEGRHFQAPTIARRAAAIAWAHRARDIPNPCDTAAVGRAVAGIRRLRDAAPVQRGRALELEPLERMVAAIDHGSLAGVRDRALLLLGFAAALRRSELVALDVEDLDFDSDRGLMLAIGGSNADQEHPGQTLAVPYARKKGRCAVRALARWLDCAEISQHAVFRRMHRGDHVGASRLSAQSVALIVKRRARAVGIPAAELSGHSLRAGYATAAATVGVEEHRIANVTRHRNLRVLRPNIRQATTAFDLVGEVL